MKKKPSRASNAASNQPNKSTKFSGTSTSSDREKYCHPLYTEEYSKRSELGVYSSDEYDISDRDTILHSTYFRRLAGVTQVVSALEPYRLNNRYTHSISVALAGRLLTKQLLKQPDTSYLLEKHSFKSINVVEAACLAHDLGHPPFGHVGEAVLNKLCDEKGVRNGYEGNAQTFRIVTYLERILGSPGMKLSRATLRAVLKYPWRRTDDTDNKRNKKWGVYSEDMHAFEFAYGVEKEDPPRRSIEADIMDWADDAAYAIDDMIDFYSVGLIPLDRLATDPSSRIEFLQGFYSRKKISPADQAPYEEIFNKICEDYFNRLGAVKPYTGTMDQQGVLSDLTYSLHQFLRDGTTLSDDFSDAGDEKRLVWRGNNGVEDYYEKFVELLKELTWQYVILSSQLAGQQEGYKNVIEKLFDTFASVVHGPKTGRRVLPIRFREMLDLLDRAEGHTVSFDKRIRVAADMVSHLTDNEALLYYYRITGNRPGSAFLPPVI